MGFALFYWVLPGFNFVLLGFAGFDRKLTCLPGLPVFILFD